MKHNMKITLLLILVFFLSQIVGLGIISQYIDVGQSSETGKTVINHDAYNITGMTPPELTPEEENIMWVFILMAILLGTVIVLAIIKFKLYGTWKAWFMMSIIVTLFYALVQFVHKGLVFLGLPGGYVIMKDILFGIPFTVSGVLTFLIVVVLAYIKVVKKNFYIHNMTEIFIYGGLAAIIVPNISVTAAIILLIGISLYDMIAVWKTKHMVTMAKFQTQSKSFAGLMMPYHDDGSLAFDVPRDAEVVPNKAEDKKDKKIHKESKKSHKSHKYVKEVKTAILGGGDIAFPLLFSGAVLKTYGIYLFPLIITITTSIALFLLLKYSKKGKFYPAMPFISAGAFTGYIIILFLM